MAPAREAGEQPAAQNRYASASSICSSPLPTRRRSTGQVLAAWLDEIRRAAPDQVLRDLATRRPNRRRCSNRSAKVHRHRIYEIPQFADHSQVDQAEHKQRLRQSPEIALLAQQSDEHRNTAQASIFPSTASGCGAADSRF